MFVSIDKYRAQWSEFFNQSTALQEWIGILDHLDEDAAPGAVWSMLKPTLISRLASFMPIYDLTTTSGKALMIEEITSWAELRDKDWSRAFKALYSEYNPIENYDRTRSESSSTSESSSDTSSQSQSTSTSEGRSESSSTSEYNSQSNSLRDDTSPYNTTQFTPVSQAVTAGIAQTNSTGQSSINGNTNTNMSGQANSGHTGATTATSESRDHGNVGVTTTQQMIDSEIELRAKMLYERVIIRPFMNNFAISVY